jgi:hypothetical protein
MDRVCREQLTGLPGESILIGDAARTNVPALLGEFIPRLGNYGAIQSAATTLAGEHNLDMAAALWVVREFARALGYIASGPATGTSASFPGSGPRPVPGSGPRPVPGSGPVTGSGSAEAELEGARGAGTGTGGGEAGSPLAAGAAGIAAGAAGAAIGAAGAAAGAAAGEGGQDGPAEGEAGPSGVTAADSSGVTAARPVGGRTTGRTGERGTGTGTGESAAGQAAASAGLASAGGPEGGGATPASGDIGAASGSPGVTGAGGGPASAGATDGAPPAGGLGADDPRGADSRGASAAGSPGDSGAWGGAPAAGGSGPYGGAQAAEGPGAAGGYGEGPGTGGSGRGSLWGAPGDGSLGGGSLGGAATEGEPGFPLPLPGGQGQGRRSQRPKVVNRNTVGIAAAIALVAGYLGVAVVAHLAPFPAKTPPSQSQSQSQVSSPPSSTNSSAASSPAASADTSPPSQIDILMTKIPAAIRNQDNGRACLNSGTDFGAPVIQCQHLQDIAAQVIIYYQYRSQTALASGLSALLKKANFRDIRECRDSTGNFTDFLVNCQSTVIIKPLGLTGTISEYTNGTQAIIVSTDNEQRVMAVLVGTSAGDLLAYWNQHQWIVRS